MELLKKVEVINRKCGKLPEKRNLKDNDMKINERSNARYDACPFLR